MAQWKQFEDLPVWQEARLIAKSIYQMTKHEPFSKDFRFVGQITVASGSIMDNIAEGFERENNKEFIYFLYIAKGSCGEVRSQLYRALDTEYISKDEFSALKEKNNVIKQVNSEIYFIFEKLKYDGYAQYEKFR